MSWQDTLTGLLDLAVPVTSEIAAGHSLTFENAWNDPTIKDDREKLVALLTKGGTIEDLIDASQHLREQHDALLAKPTLTPAELMKLGVLSGAAYTLSAQALASAATPQAIFQYTIKQLIPWVQRAVEVGILIAGRREVQIDSQPAEVHANRATDLDPTLLRELIQTTAILTRLLARLADRDHKPT